MFLSYTIIMLICSVFFTAAMFQQIQKQDNELLRQENHNKIQLIAQGIDEKFMDMDKIGIQLTNLDWVKRVRSKSDIILKDIDIIKQREICKEILTYQSVVRVSESTALLLPQKQMSIDSVSIWNTDNYFSSVGIKSENFMDHLLTALPKSSTALTIYLPKSIYLSDGNDFVIAKQLNYASDPELILFFYIDGDKFYNFVSKNLKNDLYSFKIISKDQTIFTSGHAAKNKSDVYSEVYSSTLYNWSYSFQIHSAHIPLFSQVSFLCSAVILSLIIGLSLAFLLARTSYLPVFNLLQKLGSKTLNEKEQEFIAIERSFHSLREENHGLEQLSYQYYNTARNNILISLLQGSFNQSVIKNDFQIFGLDFSEETAYLVVLFCYPDITDNQQKILDYMKLRNLCDENDCHGELFEIADQNLALILRTQKSNIKKLYTQTSFLKKNTVKALGTDVEIYYGLPQNGLLGISKSYQEAKEQSLVIHASNRDCYYYPVDWEIQIISQLKLGNGQIVQKILEELKEENASRNLSKKDNDYVTSLILNTFLRAMGNVRLDTIEIRNEFQKVLKSNDKIWPWDYLNGFAHVLCDKVYHLDNQSAMEIGEKMISYIDNNFCDSNLSQQSVADQFGVSRSTVSKIFKNAAKVNFIDYLHLRRIEKAKAFFDIGETDINKVIKQTGYENEITFKRAFVRFVSISPRKYIQQCKIDNGMN